MRPRLTWPRRWLVFAAVLALLAASLSSTALANLAGSPFDAADGNLVLNDESQDWANAPNLKTDVDKPTGSTDDSFGQGTKEDSAVPTVVSGSIPNNKSDLLRFYVANQKVSGDDFLYLAWERVQEPSGTTNMDFEFNQSKTVSSNGVTPVRTAGDILIKYDLSRGGSSPTLGYHVWLTSGSAANCEANNALPCWGKAQSLSGNFEGAINGVPVIDPIAPNAPRTLSARTFGEAAINLTDAGIFPAGQCTSFGSGYLKSRSSDAFTSELKDFIAPIPVNITNCTGISILKTDDASPASPLAGAVFTLYTDNAPVGGTRGAEDTSTSYACTTGIDGTCSIVDVAFGQYWVVETTTPANHDTAADQNVILSGTSGAVSLTFVDKRQPAAIDILKKDDAGAVLAGAVFTLYTDVNNAQGVPVSPAKSCTTGANGTCSITGILPLGTYWVVETTTPAGHTTAPSQQVTLTANQTVSLTFVNPRQPASVNIHKQDDAGTALQGAVFTLYTDNGGAVGSPVAGKSCTTDAAGDCSISNILPPGTYWVVETTTPAGHETAAPQQVTLALNQTVSLTFVDPQQFTVIVLVCKNSSNTLHGSTITVDGQQKVSLGPNGGGAISDAALCALAGARYTPKTAGTYSASVSIPLVGLLP